MILDYIITYLRNYNVRKVVVLLKKLYVREVVILLVVYPPVHGCATLNLPEGSSVTPAPSQGKQSSTCQGSGTCKLMTILDHNESESDLHCPGIKPMSLDSIVQQSNKVIHMHRILSPKISIS